MKLKYVGETGARVGFAKGDIIEVPDPPKGQPVSFPHDFQALEADVKKGVNEAAKEFKSDADKLDAAVRANLAKIVADVKGK